MLGLIALLVGVAWTKLGPKQPTPTVVESEADRLAIELLNCRRDAIKKQATYAVQIMPGENQGPTYYAVYRPIGQTLDAPVREVSLAPGISAGAMPTRIEFRPDGTATSDWQVELTAANETRTVTVDGPTGVVRILPADGMP